MMSRFVRVSSRLAVLAASAALVACAGYGEPYGQPVQGTGSYPANTGTQAQQVQYGRVADVQFVRAGAAGSGVAGTVIGGAVGGLAGHQVGGGKGRTAATIAGAVGGALIGRALEQNMGQGSQDVYRVTVQFDNGTRHAFDYASTPNVRVGDRVWLQDGQLYR